MSRTRRAAAPAPRLVIETQGLPVREAPCPIARSCGGCALMHLSEDAQRAAKTAAVRRLLEEALGPGVPVAPCEAVSEPLGYRHRARFHVQSDPGAGPLRIGFHAPRSHDIIEVPACAVALPALNTALGAVREALAARPAPGLTGLEITVEPASGRALLDINPRDSYPGNGAQLARGLAVLPGVQGVAVHPPGGRQAPPVIAGEAALRETISGYGGPPFAVTYEPGQFTQGNRMGNRVLIRRVLEAVEPSPGMRILELFAGHGNFTLPLALAGAHVTAIETSARALTAARAAAARAGVNDRVRFIAGDATGVAQQTSAEGFGAVLLDPPREGAPRLMGWLAAQRVARVVYVACDAGTFARDAKLLTAAGTFALAGVRVLDLFPQTAHVELAARFERVARGPLKVRGQPAESPCPPAAD